MECDSKCFSRTVFGITFANAGGNKEANGVS